MGIEPVPQDTPRSTKQAKMWSIHADIETEQPPATATFYSNVFFHSRCADHWADFLAERNINPPKRILDSIIRCSRRFGMLQWGIARFGVANQAIFATYVAAEHGRLDALQLLVEKGAGMGGLTTRAAAALGQIHVAFGAIVKKQEAGHHRWNQREQERKENKLLKDTVLANALRRELTSKERSGNRHHHSRRH